MQALHDAEVAENCLYIDNKSLYETLKTTYITKDVGLRVDTSRLRQIVEDEISAKLVDGKQQLADCLTKRVAASAKLIDVLESCKLFIH